MDFLIEDVCIMKNKLFFLLRGVRLLFVFDIDTEQVSIVSTLPTENVIDITDGIKILSWKNQLILTPMGDNNIWKYNVDEGGWTKIEIPKHSEKKIDMQLFISTLVKNMLIMVGCHLPYIIQIDLESNFVKEYEIRNELNGFCWPYFDRFRYYITGDNFVIPSRDDVYELIICLVKNEMTWKIRMRQCMDQKENIGNYYIGNYRRYVRDDYVFTAFCDGGGDIMLNFIKHIVVKSDIKRLVSQYIIKNRVKLPETLIESYGFDLADFSMYILC